MPLTPDEKRLLIDFCRCVDLLAWHVRALRCEEPAAVMELTQMIDNLTVIRRVLQGQT